MSETSLPVNERLLASLNPEQKQAVTLPAENALILAGAGSGKTRVLTTRIAWLLSTGQISPGGVMAVTFTNKAAKEMLARLSAMLPVDTHGMWIGTFHGLCNRFLRMHWKLAGLAQSFQILDTQDQLAAVKRLLKGLNTDLERFPPKEVSWFIANAKEAGLRPADMQAHDPQTLRKVEFYEAYQQQCEREGVADFGELMLRSYELLRDHAHLREHYQHRFKHILVDEFQDTNRLQYAWLKMFKSADPMHPNYMFVVGDDDQSIYTFRGANVGNMSTFQNEFQVKEVIKLERNYRSFGNILDAANGLISHNVSRLGKNLNTEAGAGEPIRINEAPSDFDEARWMAEEIKQLHHEGIERTQIAVLYRSNAQSRVIENQLFSAAIPYRVYGGLRFFERAEIKHALAYLRLMENPNDDTSYLRVVNFPPRGIGARTLEQLQDAARLANGGAGESLYATALTMQGNAAVKLGAFNALINVLREETVGCTLREIIQKVLDASGLLLHYEKEREGADRIENLKELINAAEAFVTLEGFGKESIAQTPGQVPVPSSGLQDGGLAQAIPAENLMDAPETISPLAAFLSHASLEAGDNQAHAGEDAVQLMTVHAAKGLEFDCVFISGLEEGLFPHENSLADVGGLEEERRLMYVAITRARKRLYLSFAQTRMLHGQTRYNIRSRFFDELPENTLKWLMPPSQGGLLGYTAHDYSVMPWDGQWNGQGKSKPAANNASTTKQHNDSGLGIGQRVFHNKFGEGTVLTLEGQGMDAKVQVKFTRHGVKWLAVSIAKLTPIEDE